MEHDLAKVGAAGSSPVSRSRNTKKDIRKDILFSCYQSAAGHSKVRVSPLRSGPRKAEVPRTSCAVSRSNLPIFDGPLLKIEAAGSGLSILPDASVGSDKKDRFSSAVK